MTGNTKQWEHFCIAVETGDAGSVEALFNEFMSGAISIRDTAVKNEMKENFYHGLLLGLLKAEGSWVVKSNMESGNGYTDIKLTIPAKKIGCIIEMKYASKGAFDAACRKAMKQIDDERYTEVLVQEGMRTIYKYGIACYRKNCKILCEVIQV